MTVRVALSSTARNLGHGLMFAGGTRCQRATVVPRLAATIRGVALALAAKIARRVDSARTFSNRPT